MLLTKEQILKAEDLPHEDVEVSEWGGSVRVRTMTGSERDSFESSISKMKDGQVEFDRENYRSKLLARVIVDEQGNRLFSDKEIDQLSRKSAKAINKLFDAAQRLNALSREVQEEIEKK